MNEIIDKIEDLVRRLVAAEEMRDHYHKEWLDALAILDEERKGRTEGVAVNDL